MGVLNWLFGNSEKAEEVEIATSTNVEIETPPSKEVFMSDLSQPIDSDAAESFRINEIMSLINTNWAEIGYKDALVNHDRSLMSKNVDKAIFEIKLKISDAMRLFSISLSAYQYANRLSIDAGLLDTASESTLRIEQVQKNADYLGNLMKELERREGVFVMIQNSYEHGFIRGIDAMIHSKYLDTPLP